MDHDEHITIARAIAKCQTALGVVDFEHARKGPTRDRWLALRNRMAVANYGLVVRVAKKVHYPRTTMQDNIQYGWFGLLKAVDRFDPDRGIRFSTYATYWVRHEIQRAGEKYDRIVRVPTHTRATARKAYRMLGQDLSIPEICERIGKTPEQVEHALASMRADVVPDDVLRDEGGARGFAAAGQSPEAAAIHSENLRKLHDALRKLPREERWLLEQRFGLNGVRHRKLREIGECRGLSRERIRQLEQAVISRLRVELSAGS